VLRDFEVGMVHPLQRVDRTGIIFLKLWFVTKEEAARCSLSNVFGMMSPLLALC